MFGFERGRTLWAAPLLLFLAVLLVAGLAFNVANLDTGGEAIPDVSRPPGTAPSPDSFVAVETILKVLFSIFVAGFIIITLYVFRKRRQPAERVLRKASWWEILGTLVSAIFFLALVLFFRRITTGPNSGGTTTQPSGGGPVVEWPTASGLPAELFLIGGLFVGLIAVVFLLRRTPFPRLVGGTDEALLDRETAANAVRETIEHLELGGDVRSAILACYRRFCVLLGERGLEDQVAMTARELESAAVRRLGVLENEASQLTSIFEEARYSEHPLMDAHRERAVRSLESIRASLEA